MARGRPRRRRHAARRVDRRGLVGRRARPGGQGPVEHLVGLRRRTAPCWRPTARSTGSGSAQGEPKLMEAGEQIVTIDLPDGAGGTVTGGPVHLLRPAVPRALPRAARRGGQGVRHPGRLAAPAGRALDAAGPRAGHREPVRRHRLQHGRDALAHRDGRRRRSSCRPARPWRSPVSASRCSAWTSTFGRDSVRATSRSWPTGAFPPVRTDVRAVRVRAPELRGRRWLNTGGRDLTLADLRGRDRAARLLDLLLRQLPARPRRAPPARGAVRRRSSS